MALVRILVAAIMTIFAAVLGLAVLAFSLLLLFFDINSQKSWLTTQASDALGREVKIGGDLALDWSWRPRLTVQDLSIANAEWGEAENFVEIEQLIIELDLPSLMKGRTVVPLIDVNSPTLNFEVNDQGDNNWSMAGSSAGDTSGESTVEDDVVNEEEAAKEVAKEAAEEATVPDDRTEFPIIDALKVSKGVFGYADRQQAIDLRGQVETALGDGGGGEWVSLNGEGSLKEKALSLSLEAGSFRLLRDSKEPYPVDLDIRLGETQALIEGTIDQPLGLLGLDLRLEISGPSLDEVFALTGVPLPPTPEYSLAGALSHKGSIWRFAEMQGRLGDSDLAGVIEVDVGAEPLTFDADLKADRLDIADLGGFIGAPVEGDAEEEDEPSGLIPDRPIDLSRLKAANGKARLEAKSILAPNLPLDDVQANLELDSGTLRLQPMSFGVARGSVDLWLSLYGGEPPVKTDVLARVRGLHLKDAFKGTQFAQETGGEIDGRIELSGSGDSLKAMLAKADGHMFLVMSGGTMSALILELIGLDAAEALGLYLGDDGDTPVEIRCLASEFEIDDGLAEAKLAVLDTPDTLIEADGRINLENETLAFSFSPHPHDVSLFNLRSKIEIEGKLDDPKVNLDIGSVLQNLPPFDFGMAEDAPCESLIEQARTEPEDEPKSSGGPEQ